MKTDTLEFAYLVRRLHSRINDFDGPAIVYYDSKHAAIRVYSATTAMAEKIAKRAKYVIGVYDWKAKESELRDDIIQTLEGVEHGNA